MKKFRSILALLLAMILIFSFAGCGSKDDSGSNDPAPSEQSQEADNNGTVTPVQPSDQSTSPTDQNSSQSHNQQSSESESSESEKPTPPDRGNENKDSSTEQPIADVPDNLKGEYSGEFTSNTDTGLNLITKWAANKNAAGSYDVTFHFYLSTYSLQVSDRSGNKLEVKTSSGTQDYTFKTKAVEKKDNKLESIFIGETTVQMTADELTKGADVKAIWDFRGSYSEKELKEIIAEGKVMSN